MTAAKRVRPRSVRAKSSKDLRYTVDAMQYANAAAALSHVTLVPLTPALARQASELAATHRLRGADAVYLAVARRYGTTLVSRDDEQRTRGSAVTICQTPEVALSGR